MNYVDMRAEQLTDTFAEVNALDGEPLDPLGLSRRLAEALLGEARDLLAWTTPAGQRWTSLTYYHGIWVRAGQDREPDLLSSFFIPDIETAATASSHPPALCAPT